LNQLQSENFTLHEIHARSSDLDDQTMPWDLSRKEDNLLNDEAFNNVHESNPHTSQIVLLYSTSTHPITIDRKAHMLSADFPDPTADIRPQVKTKDTEEK
jgi:hypothetical protein